RLACVRHAASVRHEPGSNSPMIEESEQLMRTTAFRMSSVLTSESNPRDARLTARRSNGSALHTLDHQFSKSHAQKVLAETPMLTGGPDPSQGGLLPEDTAPLHPPIPHPPKWIASRSLRPVPHCHAWSCRTPIVGSPPNGARPVIPSADAGDHAVEFRGVECPCHGELAGFFREATPLRLGSQGTEQLEIGSAQRLRSHEPRDSHTHLTLDDCEQVMRILFVGQRQGADKLPHVLLLLE